MARAVESSDALVAVCDLDGTLIDSDAALAAAFIALGVDPQEITFGHVLATECLRLEVDVADYIDAYDATMARPFDGVEELVAALGRWAVCSNKYPDSGNCELTRLSWSPEVALFADAFDGAKSLVPVLDALGLEADRIVFLGDTSHDRECARAVGATFALAGWNPRAEALPGDLVLERPGDLLALLGR